MVALNGDDRLLAAYIFYGSILVLKTLLMSPLTARQRIKNKAYASPEDYEAFPSPEDYGGKSKDKPVPKNEDVERVRRVHQNDLENIPIFLIIALLYVLSNLSPVRGIWCLRIFTAARVLHTVAYLNKMSRPRATCFFVGVICTAILGVSVLYSAIQTGVF